MTRPDRALIVAALGASLLLAAPRQGGADTPPSGPSGPASGTPLTDRPQVPTTSDEKARVAIVSVGPTRPLGSSPSTRHPVSGLQAVLDRLDGPARILLLPGHHDLAGLPFEDLGCGGCADPKVHPNATYGLRVAGEGIEIVGASRDSVFVHTNAGFGIFFDKCKNCFLTDATITGGVRDADPNATDAGIVVRASQVTIERCDVRANGGDSAGAEGRGVAGIAADKADLWVRDCRIVRNTGDGIALYRGARGFIRDNLIDGADEAHDAGSATRGVGIMLRWDADATIEGNLITRTWKGIGVYEDAHATVKQNVIEDVALYGIAYSDAGHGRPIADIRENAIYIAGGCGGWIERKDTEGKRPGGFVENAVVMTGRMEAHDSSDPTFRREAIAAISVPPRFRVSDNLLYANHEEGGGAGRLDMSEEKFRAEVRELAGRLAKRPALASSRFVRSFWTP
jgi:hypothetical protein